MQLWHTHLIFCLPPNSHHPHAGTRGRRHSVCASGLWAVGGPTTSAHRSAALAVIIGRGPPLAGADTYRCRKSGGGDRYPQGFCSPRPAAEGGRPSVLPGLGSAGRHWRSTAGGLVGQGPGAGDHSGGTSDWKALSSQNHTRRQGALEARPPRSHCDPECGQPTRQGGRERGSRWRRGGEGICWGIWKHRSQAMPAAVWSPRWKEDGATMVPTPNPG